MSKNVLQHIVPSRPNWILFLSLAGGSKRNASTVGWLCVKGHCTALDGNVPMNNESCYEGRVLGNSPPRLVEMRKLINVRRNRFCIIPSNQHHLSTPKQSPSYTHRCPITVYFPIDRHLSTRSGEWPALTNMLPYQSSCQSNHIFLPHSCRHVSFAITVGTKIKFHCNQYDTMVK